MNNRVDKIKFSVNIYYIAMTVNSSEQVWCTRGWKHSKLLPEFYSFLITGINSYATKYQVSRLRILVLDHESI